MKHLFSLNKYLWRYPWHLAGGVFFVFVSNLLALYPARVTRKTIDYLNQALQLQKVGEGAGEEILKSFFFLFLFIIGSTLLKGLFMFFMRQTLIVMSRRIEFDQKNDIYAHYQNLDNRFFKENSTGDMMARISEDVSQVRMYTGPAIMYSLNLIVLFVLLLVVMIKVNVALTLWVLAPLPLLSASIYWVSNRTNLQSLKVQQYVSSLSTISQTSFAGIRVIKSFAAEKIFSQKFKIESENHQKAATDLVFTESFFTPLITFLIGLSTLLVVLAGGYYYNKGLVSLGNIAEFVIYVNMLTWPVTSIGWVTAIIQKAAASQQRINEFLMVQNRVINGTLKPAFDKGISVEFKNVSFTYPETGIRALKDISFKINEGKTLGITGRTGSGKSTIASLLYRIYDPESGSIFIDSKELKTMAIESLRNKAAFVPQDVFLFSDTIYNNIIFGLTDTNELKEKVKEACYKAGVLSDIEAFPDQFNTITGERGITLSGGQKQRISIARALVRNPLLLILDDCLSAVDTKTEYEILERIGPAVQSCTSVIISHRINTIMNADEIIVLDEGVIAEQGNHEHLLKLNGIYAGLYKHQLESKS